VNPQVLDVEGTGLLLESLTPGILGGRLEVLEMVLEPGAKGKTKGLASGIDLGLICLEGTLEVEIGGSQVLFGPDDSAHANVSDGFSFRNPGRSPSRVLLILDPATTHL
jgi:mannose-6-phosphate isomerase-like protein (cupin superfamily)